MAHLPTDTMDVDMESLEFLTACIDLDTADPNRWRAKITLPNGAIDYDRMPTPSSPQIEWLDWQAYQEGGMRDEDKQEQYAMFCDIDSMWDVASSQVD